MTIPHKSLLIKSRDVLLAACGDRCNAEYNPCECRKVADELQAAINESDSEPVAYLAWRDGKPCYEGEDAVCEDAVWPVDGDDDRTSRPVYLHPAHNGLD